MAAIFWFDGFGGQIESNGIVGRMVASMRKIAMLPLVAFAVACGEAVTAPDDLGVVLKAQGKGPKAEYGFVYDIEPDGSLGSDCWKKSPEAIYGKTFWCATDDPPTDPTFVLRILKDGVPVEGGTVTFARCEIVRIGTRYEVGTVMDWVYCGVMLKKYRRYFGGVDYATVPVDVDGLASVTLGDFWDADVARIQAVWGMSWEYEQGDGRKAEAATKWRDLAHVGYVNPPGQAP